MPVITGVIQSGSQFTGANPTLSQDGLSFDKIAWPFTLAINSSNRVANPYVRKANVDVPAKRALSVSVANSYFGDYYHRIHVVPTEINLGDVVSNQMRNIEVWNANLVAASLNSIVGQGDTSGINLIQPEPLPATFKPNEAKTYQVGVTLTGSPTIDASYVFTFDGQTTILKISGRRVVLFPFRPNFKYPITESLEWKTDVIRSFSGKEQRRGLSNKPRRSFEFDIMLKGTDAQYWQNLMWGWQSRVFSLPIWTDRSKLTANVLAGAQTIQCDTRKLNFVAGGILVIYVDEYHNELGEIESFNNSSITLKRPLLNDWALGTTVYPCVFAHLPTELNVVRQTSDLLTSRCSFKTSPDVTDPFLPSGSATTTYDGLEVLTAQPNWQNGLGQNVTNQFSEIDFGVGQMRWLQKELNSSKMLPYSWLFASRANIADFRSFLGRQSGRLKTCWIPSWTDDFTPMLIIEASSNILPVKENGFGRMVGVNPANDRIMIRTKAGQAFYRRITNITLSPDGVNSALVLDAPLGVRLAASDITAIHMLHRCRFATDKVDFQWHTDSVAVVDSNFTTVDQ